MAFESFKLDTVIRPWPIASNLAEYLPAGDLISLARTNTSLRAALHGFNQPEPLVPLYESSYVRSSLQIGSHQTPYWQKLKEKAPFLCSSSTHTKGTSPRPCRYCSRPICEACIVRSSFANPKANTFKNRCRFLCNSCWTTGNPTKGRRFPISDEAKLSAHRGWYDPDGGSNELCVCTLKNDGWICLECKGKQNTDAVSSASSICFGQGCSEPLEADMERRKICLWCDKPLPRLRVAGETRHAWNQKMIDARARENESRRADMEEYNRKRQKLLRMSRREMRGDEAVEQDLDADLPQFVRHFDTVNYQRYMPREAAPDGDAVYGSKMGKWKYNADLLLRFRHYCREVAIPIDLKSATRTSDQRFARTNLEKSKEGFPVSHGRKGRKMSRNDEWQTLKAVALELYITEMKSPWEVQQILLEDYHFLASVADLVCKLKKWGYDSERQWHLPAISSKPKIVDEDLDLKLATRLQEEEDRKTAERMQALWDASDENGNDLGEDGEDESQPNSRMKLSPDAVERGRISDRDNETRDVAVSSAHQGLDLQGKGKQKEEGKGEEDVIEDPNEDIISLAFPGFARQENSTGAEADNPIFAVIDPEAGPSRVRMLRRKSKNSNFMFEKEVKMEAGKGAKGGVMEEEVVDVEGRGDPPPYIP